MPGRAHTADDGARLGGDAAAAGTGAPAATDGPARPPSCSALSDVTTPVTSQRCDVTPGSQRGLTAGAIGPGVDKAGSQLRRLPVSGWSLALF